MGMKDEGKGLKTKQQRRARLYTAGMNLADALRLLGKHDESRQIEVWVLTLCRELERTNENRRTTNNEQGATDQVADPAPTMGERT